MPDIPAMDDLIGALSALDRLPVSGRARRYLGNMLIEASTPDRHNPARLEPTHRENVKTTVERLTEHTMSVVQRGSAALLAMSDEEWDRLVEEANQ